MSTSDSPNKLASTKLMAIRSNVRELSDDPLNGNPPSEEQAAKLMMDNNQEETRELDNFLDNVDAYCSATKNQICADKLSKFKQAIKQAKANNYSVDDRDEYTNALRDMMLTLADEDQKASIKKDFFFMEKLNHAFALEQSRIRATSEYQSWAKQFPEIARQDEENDSMLGYRVYLEDLQKEYYHAFEPDLIKQLQKIDKMIKSLPKTKQLTTAIR